MMTERKDARGAGETAALPSPRRETTSSSSSSSRSTEELGRGRWKIIFPDSLVVEAGIACRAHRRPTGLLHSCGEAFCEECFSREEACPECGESIPKERRLWFCCE